MSDRIWLQPGDSVRVISPSGCLRELDSFQKGVEIWASRYQIQLSPGYHDSWGYLAGTDPRRRQELADALEDESCRAILCSRGGYGSTRLLENWSIADLSFPTTPKWLIGFSDITALLWTLSQWGVFCVHAPVLTTLAAEPEWSVQRLFDIVEGRPLELLSGKGWGGGAVSGRLLPANLTVADCIFGTPFEPKLEGAILALEDTAEAPYRLDRVLTHWRMIGVLQQFAGVALGRFGLCDPKKPNYPSFSAEEVLRDRIGDLNIPVVSDLPFGHNGVNAALPVGVEARLDGERGTLEILR